MSDKNLENLMTENTNTDDTTTLTEEVATEEVAVEEVTTTETLETEPTVEEPVAKETVETENVETEPTVGEVVETEEPTTEETVVEEQTTEEVVAPKEVETEPAEVKVVETEEVLTVEEASVEEVATKETAVEEIPAPVEEQVAMDEVLEKVTVEGIKNEPTIEEPVAEETFAPVEGQVTIEEVAPKKEPFKLTPPENNEELFEKMCVKRGRKLIYAPKEVIYDASFTVLGTNKKNEEGIRIKDILEAEIKEGTRLGYLDKYDGLKSSEIKEEYENDIIYEYAEQEFKKMGIIFDGKKIKVYVYDWDGKACHHVGFIDETAAADSIKYFSDKENYSFDLCGIITGGKGKRVTKNEDGKVTITKEKGGDYGIELDISVIARKD